jgi:hypothetical protein
MAYSLKFNGVNSIVTLNSDLLGNLGTSVYSIRIKSGLSGITLPSSGSVGVIGSKNTGSTNAVVITSTGLLQIHMGGMLRYGSTGGLINNQVEFDYTINHAANGDWNIYNNLTNAPTGFSGNFTTSLNVSGVNSWNMFGRSSNSATNYLNGEIQLIEVTGFTNGQTWDADLSGGTGSVLPTASGLNQGTLVNFPTDGTQWGGSGTPTPVSFTGTVPAQTATFGTAFSLNLASYFSGSLTPFTYAVTSGSLPAGLTLSGSTISGTPTVSGDVTGLVVTATDTGSNTAATNAFAINVAAAPALPSGTFTVGTITTTQNTASVPYTYSAADATSIQYRLNAGAAVTATTSPQALTGLTPNTGYTIQFRAVNGAGNGDWSTTAIFTTQPIPSTDGTFTSEPLYRLVDGALMANKALTYYRLYNPTTGALVVSKTGLSTNSSGVVSFTDAAVVTGTDYKSDWLSADGEFCMPSKAAT